jgi:uncharacterized membrane protein YdjX (TVP38/TMEM64 family)
MCGKLRFLLVKMGRWKWLIVALVIAGAIFLFPDLPWIGWLDTLTEWCRSLGVAGPVVYALLFVTAAMFCIPCMPFTLAAGYIFGPLTGALAVHSGTTVAAILGFLLSRKAGRAKVADRLRHSKRFRILDQEIAREGWKIVGALRTLPINFGMSNYLYGLTGVPFRGYFLATFLAMLPGNIIYVYFGSVGGRTLKNPAGIQPIEWVAVGLSILSTFILGWIVTRMLKRHGVRMREE